MKNNYEKLLKVLDKGTSIGHVLEKMELNVSCLGIKHKTAGELPIERLFFLWRRCGFTKHLSEIVGERGRENLEDQKAILWGVKKVDLVPEEQRAIVQYHYLKDPNARSLIEFLIKIFL